MSDLRPLSDDWDPKEHERKYLRHHLTGDLGYLVRREGKDHVRLHRVGANDTRPYREHEWIPDGEYRPLTRMHLAAIAFEADKALCRNIGLHEKARREWVNLRDSERSEWCTRGPVAPPSRKALWAHIMGFLDRLNSP